MSAEFIDYTWQEWFAWHPVRTLRYEPSIERIVSRWVWWEKIYRRKTIAINERGKSVGFWEYTTLMGLLKVTDL